MFEVGDKIIYPMHGTCVIDAVEKKEILGEDKLCYIINIPHLRMQITVPKDKAAKLGMREVVELQVLEDLLSCLNSGDTDPVMFENQKYCKDINKKKIKTGDIHKGSEVIRDLTRKSQRNKLGSDDVNVLNNARQIFVSELMAVKGLSQEQAVVLLDEALNCI